MVPLSAIAQITLTDGFWSTTFDCDDWTHGISGTLNCDGIKKALDNCAGDGYVPCDQTPDNMGEQILSSANHPASDGGVDGTGAQVHYLYTGVDGLGVWNDVSGGLYIDWPDANEFWLRFYTKYGESGDDYSWGGISYYKSFYVDGNWYLDFPGDHNNLDVHVDSPGRYADGPNGYYGGTKMMARGGVLGLR